MGYRSKVIFGVRKEYQDSLELVLSKTELKELFNHRDVTYGRFYGLTGEDYMKSDDWIVYESLYDLKWYSEYKDIKDIEHFFDNMPEDDCFKVCLGEDNELHSINGQWNEYIDYICELKII
tara:strand:+ start:2343 stop:2705 length:363 start_codon:yes stop_codon:yes gene_type:complete